MKVQLAGKLIYYFFNGLREIGGNRGYSHHLGIDPFSVSPGAKAIWVTCFFFVP